MKLKSCHIHFILCLGLAVCGMFAPANAQETAEIKPEIWINYASDDEIIRGRMPFGFEKKHSSLLLADDTLISSGQAVGQFDKRPEENVVKTYIIEYDQTVGLPFQYKDEITDILATEFDKIKKAYADLNPEIASQQRGTLKSYPVGDLVIYFDDPNLGRQAIRTSIIFANYTKIKQVAIGPKGSITAFQTKDFFKNIIFDKDGAEIDKQLENEWKPLVSPSKIFTSLAPPVSESYMPNPPSLRKGKTKELLGYKFKDPARQQIFYYNVYSYIFDEKTILSVNNVRSVININHILKYRGEAESVALTSTSTPDYFMIDGELLIQPLETAPYIDSARLKVKYKGNIMIVQEALGSLEILRGRLVDSLMDNTMFHPEQYQP